MIILINTADIEECVVMAGPVEVGLLLTLVLSAAFQSKFNNSEASKPLYERSCCRYQFPFTVHAQVDQCIANITIQSNFQAVFPPPGTVCFQCSFGNGVASDSIWTSPMDISPRTTVSGVLVISNTETVFNPSRPTSLMCSSGGITLNALVFLGGNRCSLIFH